MVAAGSPESAARYRDAFGFRRAAATWRELVEDPKVEAVIIASPQSTHRAIAEAAFALKKPVFCEKPLGESVDDSQAMVDAAEASGRRQHGWLQLHPHAREPVCPQAHRRRRHRRHHLVSRRAYRRFLRRPEAPASWRTKACPMAPWAISLRT
jgi:hypothetical protein